MSDINILAIDTALGNASVALLHHGILRERIANSVAERSSKILNMLQALMQEAGADWKELSCLAFSAGPGSLTGLKISSSLIQALALFCHKPIIKVSTLQVLALHAYELYGSKLIMPCIDAKMRQVYYGIYSISVDANGLVTPLPLQADAVSYVEDINFSNKKILIVGDGVSCFNRKLFKDLSSNVSLSDNQINCSAKDVVKIASYSYINYYNKSKDAIPLYLRLYE